MKRLLMILLSGFLTISLTAQTLTIKFNTANTTSNNYGNRNRNYQVVLDGTSYYSSSSTNVNTNDVNGNTNVANDIVLADQPLGSHTIAVYRMRSSNGNNNGSNITNGGEIYSNTFQLRQGYDMDITVNANGQVTFAERRVRNRGNRNYNQQNMAAMTDATFNVLLQNVRAKWIQSSKITAERDAFINTSNYFSTDQVRQLLLLIGSEPNRLALAKLAYPTVVDPTNFTQLYDVFNSTASRNDLNTFIRNSPNNNGYNRDNRDYNRNDRNDQYNNNNNNNNGQYRTAMADYQFSQLLQNANSQYSQSNRVMAIRNALSNLNNYFSTSQIRQLLAIVNPEGDRLSLAKMSYLRVSDPANFSSLYDLFYNQAARNDLNNYVIQNGGTTTYNNNNTQYNNRIAMDASTFSLVLQKVNNHILPWDKVRDARDAFNNTAYYFSTSQIRQILSVILTENDRLDLAKLAWSRVTDPNYFIQLFDLFTNQSNRNDLNAYIQAHPF